MDRIEVELGESPAAPANDTSVWAIGDSLALHPGLPQLVQQHLAPGDAPGQANRGDKLVTLVASALAGGDGINDADVLCQRRRKQGGGRGQGSAEFHRRQVVRCGRRKEAAPDLLRRRKQHHPQTPCDRDRSGAEEPYRRHFRRHLLGTNSPFIIPDT